MEVHRITGKNQVQEYFQSFMWLFILFIVDVKSPVVIACSIDGIQYEVGDEILSNNSCETWCVGIRAFSLSIYSAILLSNCTPVHALFMFDPSFRESYSVRNTMDRYIFSTQCYLALCHVIEITM